MTETPQSSMVSDRLTLDWGALVSNLVHPTKVWIIEAMDRIGRPLSASELEEVFDKEISLANISYHLKSLARVGVTERVERRAVRGTWESHYFFAAGMLGCPQASIMSGREHPYLLP